MIYPIAIYCNNNKIDEENYVVGAFQMIHIAALINKAEK